MPPLVLDQLHFVIFHIDGLATLVHSVALPPQFLDCLLLHCIFQNHSSPSSLSRTYLLRLVFHSPVRWCSCLVKKWLPMWPPAVPSPSRVVAIFQLSFRMGPCHCLAFQTNQAKRTIHSPKRSVGMSLWFSVKQFLLGFPIKTQRIPQNQKHFHANQTCADAECASVKHREG